MRSFAALRMTRFRVVVILSAAKDLLAPHRKPPNANTASLEEGAMGWFSKSATLSCPQTRRGFMPRKPLYSGLGGVSLCGIANPAKPWGGPLAGNTCPGVPLSRGPWNKSRRDRVLFIDNLPVVFTVGSWDHLSVTDFVGASSPGRGAKRGKLPKSRFA